MFARTGSVVGKIHSTRRSSSKVRRGDIMSAGFQHPFLSSPRSSERGKVVSAREAVRLIRPGDTVATGGFVGIGFAEEIAIALEALYLEENKSTGDFPRDLTLVYAGGQGDGKSPLLNLEWVGLAGQGRA
jgi:propionate CoA-transferase